MLLLASIGVTAVYARGVGALEAVGGTLCDTHDGAVLVNEVFRSRHSTLFQGQAAISSARDTFMVGSTPNGIRRSLLAFHVREGDFPADARVECAEVRLHAAAVVGGGDAALHRVTTAWTTTGSNALHGVNGGAARDGDATWAYSAYPTAAWDAAGGDYAADTLATSAVVGDVHAFGNTRALARVVQEWIDADRTPFNRGPFNAGFLLRGDESPGSGERYAKYRGAESAPDLVPRLIVTYTAPSQGKVHRDYAAYLPETRAPVAAQGGTDAAGNLKFTLVFLGGVTLGVLIGCTARFSRERRLGRGTGEGAYGRRAMAVNTRTLDKEASFTPAQIS